MPVARNDAPVKLAYAVCGGVQVAALEKKSKGAAKHKGRKHVADGASEKDSGASRPSKTSTVYRDSIIDRDFNFDMFSDGDTATASGRRPTVSVAGDRGSVEL